jgi:hypothetical protein
MKVKQIHNFVVALSAGTLAATLAMLTISAGRGQCPQCGYQGELHDCKHCGWRACLTCWQQKSKYNTCPNCERANP